MIYHYVYSGVAFFMLFVFFLVISRTLNNIINHLTKLEYFILKGRELKEEEVDMLQAFIKEKERKEQWAKMEHEEAKAEPKKRLF